MSKSNGVADRMLERLSALKRLGFMAKSWVAVLSMLKRLVFGWGSSVMGGSVMVGTVGM